MHHARSDFREFHCADVDGLNQQLTVLWVLREVKAKCVKVLVGIPSRNLGRGFSAAAS
jgi:hypothetical protein